jgi:hypothetical protein
VPFYIYLKIPTKRSKPFLSFAKTFCPINIVTGYIGFYHLKFVPVLYLILFSIVQKSVKKREERTLKKSVGKKEVR